MKACDIISVLNKKYENPSFIVDFYNVGRGLKNNSKDRNGPHIVRTTLLTVSEIVDDKLVPLQTFGSFVNTSTYLIQWTFELELESKELIEETVFFYWKGIKASKGLSPIPTDFDNDSSIVHRLVQWSEPAVFFHIFPKPLVVFEEKFNPLSPHLFIVHGELLNELHLYEVPFIKKNLRSRGVFVIAAPQKNTIYIWKGLKIINKLDEVVKETKLGDVIKSYVDSWKDFNIVEMRETEEDILFQGDSSEYCHVKAVCDFSPKLFFLNEITGEFMATEVEYPLRSDECTAAFPFLQSHLCISDDQPGMFLLDNNYEIWLILCTLKPSETVKRLVQSATEFARIYNAEKNRMMEAFIPLKFMKLDSVSTEFTNIFPHWN